MKSKSKNRVVVEMPRALYAALLAIITVVIVIAAIAIYAAYSQENAPAPASAPTAEERFAKLVEEFHSNNSEVNITKYFPDAEIIMREQKNETFQFRYYYSAEINKTIVACDRNATQAICPGRMDRFLDVGHLNTCIVSPSTALNIYYEE